MLNDNFEIKIGEQELSEELFQMSAKELVYFFKPEIEINAKLEKLRLFEYGPGIMKRLKTDIYKGIEGDAKDIELRVENFGENEKPLPKPKSFFRTFLE